MNDSWGVASHILKPPMFFNVHEKSPEDPVDFMYLPPFLPQFEQPAKAYLQSIATITTFEVQMDPNW